MISVWISVLLAVGSSGQMASETADSYLPSTTIASDVFCNTCKDEIFWNEHQHGCGGELFENEQNHELCEGMPWGCDQHNGCAQQQDLLQLARAFDELPTLRAVGNSVSIEAVLRRAGELGLSVEVNSDGVRVEAYCESANQLVGYTVPLDGDLRDVVVNAQQQ